MGLAEQNNLLQQVQNVLPVVITQLQEGKDIQLSFQKSKNILRVKSVEVKKIK